MNPSPQHTTFKTVIRNRLGLHARPTEAVVRFLNHHVNANVTVWNERRPEEKYDGKALLGMITLAAVEGDVVVWSVEGEMPPDLRKTFIELVEGRIPEQQCKDRLREWIVWARVKDIKTLLALSCESTSFLSDFLAWADAEAGGGRDYGIPLAALIRLLSERIELKNPHTGVTEIVTFSQEDLEFYRKGLLNFLEREQ